MKTFLMLAALLFTLPLQAQGVDHAPWQQLLERHVRVLGQGGITQVDYDGFAGDRTALQAYLQDLSAVTPAQFAAWPEAERLAWLINAYNAWTVELILGRYPRLDSIKQLGSLLRSPWQRAFIPLLGRTLSLDDIEHELIRGHFREPRIHFAVNCASIGCPALSPDAYRADRLETQLEQATRLFLADRTRNRLQGGKLMVSSIFKWYREDFAAGWRGLDSLPRFLAHYGDALGLTPAQHQALAAGQLGIGYLDYDWGLNRTP
jgi:hypothetical protein